MKIFVNTRIARLFSLILLLLAAGLLISVGLILLEPQNAAIGIVVVFLIAGICILGILFGYFREQNVVMEQAVAQITDYIAGNHDARISCDEEGELYRLFHEVNALVTILNAHAEKEKRSKAFLKDTISNISHQLKTPLAALNIYNGILQEEAKNMPQIKEFTDLSEQELDRIETLVQNLLKIAKIDAGAIVLEKTSENLAEMMDEIERQFQIRARLEKKEIVLSGSEMIVLECDRNWIMEAIGNIVKNAFDHTIEGNTIQISWKKFASIVQIAIRDNGSGIHPEDLPHIFKRFYRSRFSKDTQGIGLGLPLVKAIVEAHDGTVEVESEPGKGTAFTISIRIPTKL